MKDFVKADNPKVGAILREIVSIVLERGAELHPALLLIEKQGAMGLHCDGSLPLVSNQQAQRSLVRMPRELLLPTAGILWEDRSDRLVLSRIPEHLSPIQLELLELHIALYNAAGKLPWMIKYHPHQLLQERPVLLEAVRGLRPQTDVENSTLSEAFISNRNCTIVPRSSDVGDPNDVDGSMLRQSAVFPILDITNNHYDGARFEWSDTTVSMAIAQPAGTSECFLRYGGRRDVLDLAIGMGYLDQSTPFAHSAPVRLVVDGLGALEVKGLRSKPAHPLDPPQVEFTEKAMVLSHLTCHQRKPHVARLALSLAVQGAAKRSGCPVSLVQAAAAEVMQALVGANQRSLDVMQRAAEQCMDRWPSAQLLIAAARRQAEILNAVLMPCSG